jgi:coenzyme F420-reducing hydrogenase delta subunit
MKKDTEQDDGGEWTRRKELLSDFQVELILQTKNIDKLVASMDEAHTEFQDEIFEFDDDIERLEFEKRQKKLPHVPGLQIEKLIRDMST